MTHQTVESQESTSEKIAGMKKKTDVSSRKDSFQIATSSEEYSSEKTAAVAARSLGAANEPAVCSPRTWTRPPPLSPVQRKLLFSTMNMLSKTNTAPLCMEEPPPPPPPLDALESLSIPASEDSPPLPPPWTPEDEIYARKSTAAESDTARSFSSGSGLTAQSSFSSFSSTEESPRLMPQPSLSNLRSPRKAPFSPRGSYKAAPTLLEEWSNEKGFFQKTAKLALSLYYLFPKSVKRNFSKKELHWIDLLIDKYLKILLARGHLKHTVMEILQLVGKEEAEFQNLLAKIHSPLINPAAEEALEPLKGNWVDHPALSSFELRERFAKHLAHKKFIYLGSFFKNYSNEEKKCFDLFLRAFALESQCRFQEQPFRKALFLAAKRHTVQEKAILSLIAKYEQEEAFFLERRSRGMSQAAGDLYLDIVSSQAYTSESYFEVLCDGIATMESQTLNHDYTGFFLFMRALDLLVRSEEPLADAWDQMLRPDCMERYFLSKSYEKNLSALHEKLEMAAPRILIGYHAENPEGWLRQILQKASSLEPVQVAITPDQKLLLNLQTHANSSLTGIDGIYTLFSNISLRRIYDSWNDSKNAKMADLFLENLLNN